MLQVRRRACPRQAGGAGHHADPWQHRRQRPDRDAGGQHGVRVQGPDFRAQCCVGCHAGPSVSEQQRCVRPDGNGGGRGYLSGLGAVRDDGAGRGREEHGRGPRRDVLRRAREHRCPCHRLASAELEAGVSRRSAGDGGDDRHHRAGGCHQHDSDSGPDSQPGQAAGAALRVDDVEALLHGQNPFWLKRFASPGTQPETQDAWRWLQIAHAGAV